jgi:hypothetical protein
MTALLCFFLILSVSPFKSKSRLEAENAALTANRCGTARADPADERGKSVVGSAAHPW